MNVECSSVVPAKNLPRQEPSKGEQVFWGTGLMGHQGGNNECNPRAGINW